MLTISEVAERLRVSSSWVRKAIGTGALVATNIGLGATCEFRISEEDLAEFLEARVYRVPE